MCIEGAWNQAYWTNWCHPGNFDRLQELMEITLQLDIRYHDRKNENGGNQEKQHTVTGSNSFRPAQDSYSKNPHHEKNKGKNFQVSKDNPHAACLNKEKKLIDSEKVRRIKEGLCNYCGGRHPTEKCFKIPQNRPGYLRGFPSKQGRALVIIMMCSMALTYFLQEEIVKFEFQFQEILEIFDFLFCL
ncbi:hypothetical protein O181_017844 [Austropuccinia psidii MF-1]|uniref:Uncharacterized protein n=1 Tax=Austropuccinia psidii MF-1 TaxID=1389203 RepID=A0A9Q3C6H2_9BASI|nr:hypothetical protein [Austropuccinia psidii MF-1]